MLALWHEFLDALLYLGLLTVIFVPLERVFFAHRQNIFRRFIHVDLLFYFLQSVVFAKLTLWVLQLVEKNIAQVADVKAIIGMRQEIPLAVQIVVIVLLSDFLIYWGHRFSHKNSFLWRFHKIHHTAVTLDWLAAFREHPLDNIYTRIIVNLPAIILGFELELIAGYVVFRGLWGNFIHANVDINVGWLRYVLGSPRLHHWHHDPEKNYLCNFANLMPIYDVMFKTYYHPGEMPKQYGIDDKIAPNYLAQLWEPLLPQKSKLRKCFLRKESENITDEK